jgi:epsin
MIMTSVSFMWHMTLLAYVAIFYFKYLFGGSTLTHTSCTQHVVSQHLTLSSTVPVITRLMWESMENQRPAAWRVVFKGLTLLEHLVKNGSERCVDDARNHSPVLKKLFQFNYYEGTIDRGLGVREKSKQLIEMLGDDERIREERSKAKKLRERFGGKMGGVGSTSTGGIGGGGGGQYAGYGNDSSWDSRAGGGGGGYGESGIGGNAGGRSNTGYNDTSYGGDSGGGFSGRYSDDSATRASASASAVPTFATIPDDTPQKKVIKKKKKKVPHQAEDPTPVATPAAPGEYEYFCWV